MICKLCGFSCRQIEKRHSWKFGHCAKCHYLGNKSAYGYQGKKINAL